MGRNKLARFKANEENRNVVQEGKEIFEHIKGNWRTDQFKNEQPIVVELACGRGEFTVGLAREYPEQNFIGVDIKGARIWKGSTIAIQEGLENVAFLRTQIELLDRFFAEKEISELWITFPDPRPRDGDEKKRLTSPRFLEMYKPMLQKDGWIHFKTDNTALFEYTVELLQSRDDICDLVFTHDFYASEFRDDHHGIKTRYEAMFSAKGEKIKYLKFRFISS
ncbi:tRNA (guanosine(46)-N7)-methyltransferase TrmB [Echinicola strongylocentroti]|uniref:tRNA (guanine-N(7)-)-methyltransferase n=1 Tax=Echinicola strongylocentroti TaxID=1795355 RepID=A0A2Z4ICV7_9BACT|nr:tRNA (guanosine(46)-N7)-methyltransferase TrmB [Echinicola strongylocentroti]AWW28802.1 tRNA (guanosine(46)-N7)-methyltransferase TrmB [Echinicola strongylocentroti]